MFQRLLRTKSIEAIKADAALVSENAHAHGGMKKVLTVRDLTFLGVAAVIGAGIFSSIGKASADGGPAVVFLYVFTALACGFAALCYAEFASTVPVSGSAYTYAYVAFGELFAWIIGWDLLMEYAIGNIAVAISWSDYFTNLLDKAGFHLPEWTTMDFLTARRGFQDATASLSQGASLASLDAGLRAQYLAWSAAPQLGPLRVIMDLPALFITAIITYIVYIGINESRQMNNVLVMLKLAVVFLVIVLGGFYVNPDNWSPFAPEGFAGIMKGVSAVFFAYIGFDAISTTAEECVDAQRDLPKGMIYSLVICTVLYVAIALVLTGMVPYTQLNVGDPLAKVFDDVGLRAVSGIIAVSAIIATASVLLVFQLGQPRIWMSMSRDGLLPPVFSKIHPRFGTPSFSTILTGFVVAVPALFLNLDLVLALTSIGTLFAFVLVCGGILVLQQRDGHQAGKFRVPYINGKYATPLLVVAGITATAVYIPGYFQTLLSVEALPMLLFWLVLLLIALFSFLRNLSLIPVLGLVSCFYLMAQEHYTNWLRFLIWLAVGLVVYFIYGVRHSRLSQA